LEEKLSLELEYIRNITFLDESNIIFKTIIKVFNRKDINAEGMDTAEDLGDYLLRTKVISQNEYLNIIEKSKKFVSKLSDVV